jgi:hypothetical protein
MHYKKIWYATQLYLKKVLKTSENYILTIIRLYICTYNSTSVKSVQNHLKYVERNVMY